jgi:hypothetical protein
VAFCAGWRSRRSWLSVELLGAPILTLINRVLKRRPLLWAASVPAVLVCTAWYLSQPGRLIMSHDIGPNAFINIGLIWYLTALPPVWLATYSKYRRICVAIAAVVPPAVALALLFFFGQLAPSQEEFESNLRSFHFLLLVIAFIGVCVAVTYSLLVHQNNKGAPI